MLGSTWIIANVLAGFLSLPNLAHGVPVSDFSSTPSTALPLSADTLSGPNTTGLTNDAPLRMFHCNRGQRQHILHAWYYASLEVFHAGTAIKWPTLDPVFLAMFGSQHSAAPVRDLLRSVVDLRPLPHGTKLPPIFSCVDTSSPNRPLTECTQQSADKKITTITFPELGMISLCPSFFSRTIVDDPLQCPVVKENRFMLNARGRAFSFGTAFGMIKAVASLYTLSRPSHFEPPSNAIHVLNEVVSLPKNVDVLSSDRIASYFLSKCFYC